MSETDRMAAVLARVMALPRGGGRRLVAVAGPPGSGKSTFAADLVARIRAGGRLAALVPMDGFHLDNRVLANRGLLSRKGAPETFDTAGIAAALARLATGDEVVLPLFDRAADLAVAGAVIVGPDHEIAVMEGNYLCLGEPAWRGLARFWDLSIYLDVPDSILRARLVQRWLDHGLDPAAAVRRADGNDMANARRVSRGTRAVDVVLPAG